MNVLFISKRLGCSTCVSLGRRGLLLWLLFFIIALPAGGSVGGYYLAKKQLRHTPHQLSAALEQELAQQREQLDNAKRTAQENLNALSVRLGELQAHVMRLDALGQRVTEMANLDDGEFDFTKPPGQGGPANPAEDQSVSAADFIKQLDDLSQQLDDRAQQLQVLETMLMNHSLQKEIVPAGRPVKTGWLSSHFGMRTDPFTGKKEFHSGLDFAGKKGSDVIAVASGVVTWASARYGYGNLVEINHGNGYTTRYGHNQEVLVKVGQTVKKGQVIAHMGSTGRSTGPHCHFEVRYNGRAINPEKFITASR